MDVAFSTLMENQMLANMQTSSFPILKSRSS